MTTLMLLAVLGTGQAAGSDTWLSDYGEALTQARESGKPLLIVIDRPANAARVEHVSHSASGQSSESLKHYILCRVDADTAYGQAVAKAFGTSSVPYTAIIDKRGEKILFTRAGRFSMDEWNAALVSYQRGVRPVAYQPPVEYQPAYSGRAFCAG